MNVLINNYITTLNNVGRGFCSYSAGIFIQSSLLIILLLLIDLLIRKRVRASLRYWIWMLVFVKLILPPTLCLPTGIGYWCGDYLSSDSVLKQISTISKKESAEIPAKKDFSELVSVPLIQEPTEFADITKSQDYVKSAKAPEVFPPPTDIEPASPIFKESPAMNPVTWQAIVFLIWLVGLLVISVLLIQRVLFVRGLVAQSKPSDEGLTEIMNQCRGSLGIRLNIKLRLSGNISSPAVCGLINPAILMPPNLIKKLSPDRLKAVLIHELAHIKRGDLWINLVQTILQIIYFYNPFVWLANAVVRRIREQAVDEMVLVALGAEAKSYSNTLIDVAEMAFVKTSLSLRLIGVVESKKALHQRIKLILNRPLPKKAKLGIIGLLVVIIIGAILLPMAKSMSGPPDLVIKGVVKDAQTNEPIVGARVFDDKYGPEPDWEQIRPNQRSKWGAITNKAGQYSFLTWPEHHSIKVEAPGYKTQSRNLYKGHFVIRKKDEEIFDFALEQVKKTVNDGLQIDYDHAGLTQITVENGKLKYVWHTSKKDLIALRQDLSSYDRHEFSKELTPTDLSRFEKWIDETGLFSLHDSFAIKDNETYGSAFETSLKVISGNKRYEANWTGDSKLTKEVIKAQSQLILICDNLRISNSQFVATLPNGVTVELIGICEHPSQGKQWWRPDGSFIGVDRFRNYDFGDAIIAENNQFLRIFALRFNDDVLQDMRLSWDLNNSRGSRYQPDYIDKEAMKLRAIQVIEAVFAEDIQSTNLKVGIATGQWKTVAAGAPGDRGAYTNENITDRDVIYHEARQENGYVHMSATHLLGKNYDCRIIARGKDGKLYEPRKYSNHGDEMRECKSEFDIPLEQVKFFHLQARQYEWCEFKNVSLQPALVHNDLSNPPIPQLCDLDRSFIKGIRQLGFLAKHPRTSWQISSSDKKHDPKWYFRVNGKDYPLHVTGQFASTRHELSEGFCFPYLIKGQQKSLEGWKKPWPDGDYTLSVVVKNVVWLNPEKQRRYFKELSTEPIEFKIKDGDYFSKTGQRLPEEVSKSQNVSIRTSVETNVQADAELNWTIEDYGQTKLLSDKEKLEVDNWVSIFASVKNKGRYFLPDRGLTLKDLIKAAGYDKDKLAKAYVELIRRTRQGNITARSIYSRNLKTLLSGQESDIVLRPHDSVGGGYVMPSPNAQEFWGQYSFGDVVELTVNDDNAKVNFFADLDAGRLITPPDTLNNNDENAVLRWIKDNGIDVMGETAESVNGLIGFNMYAARVDNYFWDASHREFTDRLLVRIDDPVLLSVEDRFPVTYLIKTSKYKLGILQILGFSENPEGIKIRYKLLNKKTASKPDTQLDKVSVVGDWQYIGHAIPPDFNDVMELTEHIELGSIGHDAEGKTFITYIRDGQEAKNRQYRFVLFTKNGRILEPDGHLVMDEGKRLKEKFTFDEPFVTWRLKGFKFQARPLPPSGIDKISSQLKKGIPQDIKSGRPLPSEIAPPGRYAVELDGVDDYLLVPDSPSLRLEPPFTIEMWIKTKLPPDASEYRGGWALISKGFTVGTPRAYLTGFGIKLDRFQNEPSNLHIDFCKSNHSGIYSSTYSGYPLTNGVSEWIYIHHVFEGKYYKSTPGHPLVMGKFLIPTENPFKGLLGEVRLWNGYRTRRELSEYKNVALTGTEPGLTACWTFEQTEGQFAYDISPNGNHARLGKSEAPDNADPKWIDLQGTSTE